MNDLNELQTWLLIFCFVLYYVLLYSFRNHKYLRWMKEWWEIVLKYEGENNIYHRQVNRIFYFLILISIWSFPITVVMHLT
jgi:hypothetical protein